MMRRRAEYGAAAASLAWAVNQCNSDPFLNLGRFFSAVSLDLLSSLSRPIGLVSLTVGVPSTRCPALLVYSTP